MSDVTIKTWVALESEDFDDFNEYVATVLEGGMFRSMAEFFHQKLKDSDSVDLEMPWGTYHAEMKDRGDSGVVNVTWAASKGFAALMNDESDATAKFDRNYQDTFEPEFVKMFTDYVAYGMFNPEDPKNKDKAMKQRGILLSDSEVTYFLNGYALVLYNIAKDRQRDGKIYRLEINNAFPHGTFDFEYNDDGTIDVKFTAHKVFKQACKDDTIADKAREGDYVPLTETKVERVAAA